MNILKTTLLAAALFGAGAAPALAADTVNFNVKIVIQTACDVAASAPTDVNFGTVASTATNIDNAGTLRVRCTPGSAYNIALNNGQNGSTVNDRKMAKGTDLVPYQLYRASARGVGDVWGATVGTNTYAGSGNGAVQDVTVYGRVPSANFPAGSYNDVVMATIIY